MAESGAPYITVSLVTYRPEWTQLASTVGSLARAAAVWEAGDERGGVELQVVDNSPQFEAGAIAGLLEAHGLPGRVLTGHGNIGFGRGHNLAMAQGVSTYHLILNPDVEMADDALAVALAFMESHPECGLLSPAASWDDGARQYLCKRYPSVLDLLLRGFAPGFVKRQFAARLARYEMSAETSDAVLWDPPIVSGCFMLFRGEVLCRLGGFDPHFFLYFEDFDLTLRAARMSRVAYVPAVRIVHHGGHAAKKGWRHIGWFGRSMLRFFNAHGWRWW